MLVGWRRRFAELEAKVSAIDKSQAVIEFDLDGRILTANDNFLRAMGYGLAEVVGKHHAMFVEPAYKASAEYAGFWDKLKRGEFQAGRFKRLAKGGREIWIEATYNPVLDASGRPLKVIKFATDITRQMETEAEHAGRIAAIDKSQAVISFTLDGDILDANANFLGAVGYELAEIKGRHHSMFVDARTRDSAEYKDFWGRLRRGEFQTGRYKRFAKGGREIWIEASYNPILDASGRPYKVVKFATDVSEQVRLLADLRKLIEENFAHIDRALRRSEGESGAASRSSGEAASKVQTMAAAAEELAASAEEIAQRMGKASEATNAAFERASVAAGQATKLSDAAAAMGGVVGLIHSIAGQINLLALNATIESARAGEAGRGFAVVAQEVKNLANQAAKATEQIGAEIEGVQSVSGEVATSLASIRECVETMRSHVVSISSAVEQQNAVTRDMSSSMQSAAQAVGGIAGNAGAISSAVAQVAQAVATTKEAAGVLAR